VCFNIPPDEEGGGPPSGFCKEEDGVQTHNVVEAIPGQDGYASLWRVTAYPPEDFDSVVDLESAIAVAYPDALALVNCPVSWLE
jgi:hypothetical protein